VRRNQRIPVNKPTRLHPNAWSSLEVQLVDLSNCGFQARCEAKVITGLPVQLDIAGIGRVEATVTWRRGSLFGAKFQQPVDLSRCPWAKGAGENTLARLLVQRAAAFQAGDARGEGELRRQILTSLPIRRAGQSAGRRPD